MSQKHTSELTFAKEEAAWPSGSDRGTGGGGEAGEIGLKTLS